LIPQPAALDSPRGLSIYLRCTETVVQEERPVGIVLMLHSIVRWVVVLVALIALVRFALGWVRGGSFAGMDRGLTAGFSGLMDVQGALGLIYLVWAGLDGQGFPLYRIEHALMMVVAIAVSHLASRWKNAPDRVRYRNSLFGVLGALALVFMGVLVLPGGAARWTR
jgi:hypothetical protein